MFWPLLACLAGPAWPSAGEVPAPTAGRYALVIGNNYPLWGEDSEPLSYADDDAFRFAELLEELGARTILLTSPDPETRERHPALAERALMPTLAKLEGALRDLEQEIASDVGRETELYFFFSGHASGPPDSARLALSDGTFSRQDLFQRVLARLPAHRFHVLIDTCQTPFLVGSHRDRIQPKQIDRNLDRFPQAGFLLSSSESSLVQEWSGYRSGVFTHQVLSAMRGAADVDLDGKVSYAEVHAYLVAANLGVKRDEERIHPYVRQPTFRLAPLIDLESLAPEHKIHIPEPISGHITLADEQGTKILEAHKEQARPMMVFAPSDSPLYLNADEESYAIETSSRARTKVFTRLERPIGRGATPDKLRKDLFVRPLTPEFVAGVDAMAGARAIPSQRISRRRAVADDPTTLGLFLSGGAFTVLGVAMMPLLLDAQSRANDRPLSPETEGARATAENWRAVMIVGYAAGAALLSAGILRATLQGEP